MKKNGDFFWWGDAEKGAVIPCRFTSLSTVPHLHRFTHFRSEFEGRERERETPGLHKIEFYETCQQRRQNYILLLFSTPRITLSFYTYTIINYDHGARQRREREREKKSRIKSVTSMVDFHRPMVNFGQVLFVELFWSYEDSSWSTGGFLLFLLSPKQEFRVKVSRRRSTRSKVLWRTSSAEATEDTRKKKDRKKGQVDVLI